MKTRHMLGWLMATTLFGGCSSIGPDREDDVIIITDKGLDIDDDKKFEKPTDNPSTPSQPGGSQEEVKDTTVVDDNPKTSPKEDLPTLYIETDDKVDTTLFEGNYATIESHIVIRSGGILQIIDNHTMHTDATITIEQGGKLWISGCLRQVDLTIKERGTLELEGEGAIILASRGSLHLEPNSIIKCTGILYPDNDGNGNIGSTGNDGWNIYAPAADPISSELEKLDSLEIQQMISY